MKKGYLPVLAGLVLAIVAVVLVVAWKMGGPRPTDWIEQPVVPESAAAAQ